MSLWLERYQLHSQLRLSSSLFNRKDAELHEAMQGVVICTGSTGSRPKRYAALGLGKGHKDIAIDIFNFNSSPTSVTFA